MAVFNGTALGNDVGFSYLYNENVIKATGPHRSQHEITTMLFNIKSVHFLRAYELFAYLMKIQKQQIHNTLKQIKKTLQPICCDIGINTHKISKKIAHLKYLIGLSKVQGYWFADNNQQQLIYYKNISPNKILTQLRKNEFLYKNSHLEEFIHLKKNKSKQQTLPKSPSMAQQSGSKVICKLTTCYHSCTLFLCQMNTICPSCCYPSLAICQQFCQNFINAVLEEYKIDKLYQHHFYEKHMIEATMGNNKIKLFATINPKDVLNTATPCCSVKVKCCLP